jgi:type III secretion protein Y
MSDVAGQAVELLHTLGHLYGRHGQIKRGLALLVVAARLAPDDVGVLRTLADAFLTDGSPRRAITVLKRLRQLPGGDHPVVALLESRALWAAGDTRAARMAFRDFLTRDGEAKP